MKSAKPLTEPWSCTAFLGTRRIASGQLEEVARAAKAVIDRGESGILVFDDTTSELIEIDFRGTAEDVRGRLMAGAERAEPDLHRGPGRPKLGVIAREVTLLPRHWDWLSSQPGGASVALRKLVEEARRANADIDRMRQSQEATYRFMSAMAGDAPGFEEATRALFAKDRGRFDALIASWPADVRDHTKQLATHALGAH